MEGQEKLRVLIVDDDPACLWHIGAKLESRGYEVLVAPMGPMGIQRAIHEGPDLIILDAEIPDPDGYEVCRCIREFSAVPIIMLTASLGNKGTVKALNVGADHCLIKPFHFEELVARMQSVQRRVAMGKKRHSRLLLPATATDPGLDTAKSQCKSD